MTNNSIGQFIAALRKANGLTQQAVADKLNVSNKAVSRWERGECAPDLSLIPALAEMFGVTCDELLKGERIPDSRQSEKSEPKVEKQFKALVNRSISGFKNLIWISLMLSSIGLICMFGISYGFYRPVIGFFVMLLFEAAAFIITAIAINKMKSSKTDNELFENADSLLVEKFNKALGTYSFIAFFTVISTILLSLPLVIFQTDFVESVMTIESYLLTFCFPIALILTIIFLKIQIPFAARITEYGLPYSKKEKASFSKAGLMTFLQLGMVLLAGILFIIAPSFDAKADYLCVAGLALIVFNIIIFLIFILKYKSTRKTLLLPGIRNMLMIPSGFLLSKVHHVVVYSWNNQYIYSVETTPVSGIEIYNQWNFTYLLLSIIWAALITVIFAIIEKFRKSAQ